MVQAIANAELTGATPLVFRFERTYDWDLVKAIVTHPRIWPHVTDDYSPSAEAWQPFKEEAVWHVLAYEQDDSRPLGLWILTPQNGICWEVHTCLLPAAYGPKGVECGKQAIDWLFRNSRCVRLVTQVPGYNILALRYAKLCGMTTYGINPKAYLKDGQLFNIALLGVSKCR